MLIEGISVLKGKEPRRLKCWEGYEYKRWEDRRAKDLLAFLREGIFCWWEEQRVGSIFWVESVEESYNISVSGSHHQRTWIIFGGDSEVSMLNFFLPIGHLHRLRMLFLLSHPLLFPLMWRLYCLGVDNKGHTCLLLIGYECLRITVEDDCFLDVLESCLGSSLIHSSFSILHHGWLTLSVMRNTWPCFVWFSLIQAWNWEPFLFFLFRIHLGTF